MMVHLNRELFARFYCDTFNLEAFAIVDGVIAAPWTEYFAVELELRTLVGF